MQDSATGLSEAEWLLFKKGDERIFKKVFKAHYGLIRYIGHRCGLTEAQKDDVVQETFLRLSQRLAQLEKAEALGAWLSVTARNVAIDIKRKQAREEKHTQAQAETSSEEDASRESHLRELEVTLTAKFIDKVASEPGGESFLLFYRDGLTAKEIAAKNDENLSTVTMRLSRMRTKFGDLLKDHINQLRDKRGDL